MSEAAQAVVPARMINEYVYCPRLAVLEWVHGEWVDNADTVDGAWKHRRADKPTRDLPGPAELEADASLRVRSLWLTAQTEGITAKLDVAELEDGHVAPVDTKRGSRPDIPGGAWDPERVQLCAQGLVLRENGHRCDHGYVWYAESRERVRIDFDDTLIERTRAAARDLRSARDAGRLPPPLIGSAKCPRCSLVEICLPDETHVLSEPGDRGAGEEMRQLLAPRPDGLPMYVTDIGATVGVSKGELRVTSKEGKELARARVRDTSAIVLRGAARITTPALTAAMQAEIPVCYTSFGGWFLGVATGHPHKNVVLRRAQWQAHFDDERTVAVARSIVRGKIRNQRTLLRRNHPDLPKDAARELTRLASRAGRVGSVESLRGLEGAAAKLYFRHFDAMIRSPSGEFAFEHRNRRPPRDPVNALLSYAYTLLTRDVTTACIAAGFDPYVGFLHEPRYGRPALALDLIEEFRPLIADSVVLMALNNGEVGPASFVQRATGCSLTQSGRRSFIATYERRMDQMLRHPVFGYRATWRRIIDIQVRLLGRHLLGEIPEYVPIETR